jgi:hypothetical protein
MLLMMMLLLWLHCRPYPGFAPLGEKWRCEYQGICIRHGITSRFQTASLFSAPYYHTNSRDSLLRLLFEKMGIDAKATRADCSIASRFTFMRGGFDEQARERRLQNQLPTGTGHDYRNSDYVVGVNMVDELQPEIEFEHAHRTISDVLWGTVDDPINSMLLPNDLQPCIGPLWNCVCTCMHACADWSILPFSGTSVCAMVARRQFGCIGSFLDSSVASIARDLGSSMGHTCIVLQSAIVFDDRIDPLVGIGLCRC